ncbi:ionotropic receptor 25a-like [Phymastichus coffea]|uniref:ionotropic receptor 25a-like n=1 Tax=Phymastichus coffea TaxID=108790 RepID=UPI00273B3AFD|nr:ionotropic receptor 25a-like [Phymastichus coffea]
MMNKTVLRVSTIPKPPFVIYDEQANHFDGMLIELLHELSLRLGFGYNLTIQEDGKYGHMDDHGNWDGLIGELTRGNADVGLAAFSVMTERMGAVDFTEAVYKPTGISVLMLKTKSVTSFFRFLTILEAEVWWCILGAYLLTSVLVWIFDTWSPYSYQNNVHSRKNDRQKRVFTLKESLWFSLTSLTPQGGGEAPINLSGRIVAATWWLFGFIIAASYTANLAAFFTISKYEKTIESFDDLINQYRYTYTVIENSTTHTYFRRMNDIEYDFYEKWKDMTLNNSLTAHERAQLAVWEYPLSDKFIKIYSAVQHNNMVLNLSQALAKFAEENSRFSLITETIDVQYQVLMDCRFREIGPEFSKKPLAIALPKNSIWTKRFNDAILELVKESWLFWATNRWWDENPNRVWCNDYTINTGLSIENIGGLFVVIGAGIVIAIATLIYEFFYFNFWREKMKRFYNDNFKKLDAIVYFKTKVQGITQKVQNH